MKIKSLLIGSAAALAGFSSANAADAIVAAEPEPMEYVRVCDAFGTGFFYIPGTETCLRVSAEVRFAVNFGDAYTSNGEDWESRTRVRLRFDARNDTELGTLQSYIELQGGETSGFSGGTAVGLRQGYVSLGGFAAGRMLNWWDDDIAGEADVLNTTSIFNTVRYVYTGDAFTFGVGVDDLTNASYDGDFLSPDFVSYGDAGVGVSAVASAKLGGAAIQVVGGYDFQVEEGAVRAIVTADIGPGTLGLAGVYASGTNVYANVAEWTVAASYNAKITDKFYLTPSAAYYGDLFTTGEDAWVGSLVAGYNLVDGLVVEGNVQYTKFEDAPAGVDDDAWGGYVRLIRTF
jgi:hypothetical protein